MDENKLLQIELSSLNNQLEEESISSIQSSNSKENTIEGPGEKTVIKENKENIENSKDVSFCGDTTFHKTNMNIDFNESSLNLVSFSTLNLFISI